MNFSTKKKIGLGAAALFAAASIYVSTQQKAPIAALTKTLKAKIIASNPWVINLPTICTQNVSDSAGLTSKLSTAIPGDVICLDNGTYTGVFSTSKSGTSISPIVIQAKDHATISGNVKLNNEYNYLLKMEVTGGSGTSGIDLFCKNCGVINNVVHGVNGAVGIGAWNTGPGQVIYGNIVYSQIPNNNNPHNIYTQNSYNANGYKYFVGNYVGSVPPTGNTFNFHAYAQGSYISGYWLQQNIFNNGQMLIGSWSSVQPDHHQVYKQNYNYKADVRMGYKRPTWFEATDNYLGRSYFESIHQWGSPEVLFPQLAGPTIFKNNTLVNSGNALRMTAYSYADPCSVTLPDGSPDPACPRKEGVGIRSDNDMDSNKYVPNFVGSFWAGGVQNNNVTDLQVWRNLSKAAGKEFEINSTTAPSEPSKYFYTQNEYDPLRGHLAVFNWQNLPTVPVTLPKPADIRAIEDPYGPIVVSCLTYPCNVPAAEFSAFLVTLKDVSPPPTCDCDMNAADAELVKALGYIDQNRKTKAKTAVNKARTIIAPCKN